MDSENTTGAENQQGRLEDENNATKVLEEILRATYGFHKKQCDDLYNFTVRQEPSPEVMVDLTAARAKLGIIEVVAHAFEERTGSELTIGRDTEKDRESK